MKNKHTKLGLLVLSVLIAGQTITPLHAAELSEGDKQFLAQYEKVRAALAADDLPAAKLAATDLKEEGASIASSDKIATARTEFAKLSEHAIKIAKGQSDYYVVNCPMLHKEWVQPKGTISNPYAGTSMPTCGSIRKQTTEK